MRKLKRKKTRLLFIHFGVMDDVMVVIVGISRAQYPDFFLTTFYSVWPNTLRLRAKIFSVFA